MSRRTIIVVSLIVIGIALAHFGFNLAYPTYTLRYRLTVDVNVNGETKSGSSVIEVRYRRQPQVFLDNGGPYVLREVTGEAVLVDLGQGKNVIALLASGDDGDNVTYPSFLIPRLFGMKVNNDYDFIHTDSELKQLTTSRERYTLSDAELPTFIALSKLGDPTTARIVQPAQFSNVFGSGVSLKDVKVELTTDAVTHGIESKLPWLNSENGAYSAYFAWRNGDMRGSSLEVKSLFEREL